MVKNLPAMQETPIQSLGWEDPLQKGMAIHSSILACRIPWTEEPGRLQSMGSHSQTLLTLTLPFFLVHLQCCTAAASVKFQQILCVRPKGSVLWQYLWKALGHPDFAYLPRSLLPPSACPVCLARECSSSTQILNMFASYDLTPLCSVAASGGHGENQRFRLN